MVTSFRQASSPGRALFRPSNARLANRTWKPHRQPVLDPTRVVFGLCWRALLRFEARPSSVWRQGQQRAHTVAAASPVEQGLSEEQAAAVTATQQRIRVNAVPGSGKTRVLIARIAHLVQERGVPPRQILAITFTRKAAGQLQTRIAASLGERAANEVVAGTFHSFAAHSLRNHIACIPSCGRDRRFTILDQADSVGTMTNILKERGRAPLERKMAQGLIAESDFKIALKQSNRQAVQMGRTLQDQISTLKGGLTSYFGLTGHQALDRLEGGSIRHDNPELLKYINEDSRRIELAPAFDDYNERLRIFNHFDYDDLMAGVVALFRDRPDILKRYQQTYSHILVDEFQDTNAAQYHMVYQLAGSQEHEAEQAQPLAPVPMSSELLLQCLRFLFTKGNLFIVGDPDQAIYGWRGANNAFMENHIQRDFQDLVTLRLHDNYRSTPEILAAAAWTIARQDPVKAGRLPFQPQCPSGPDVEVHALDDGIAEARWVAETILSLTKSGQYRRQDCAILFRRHVQGRLFEQAMVKAAIPYVLLGGEPFWGRKEIKDVMAYLHLLADLRNEAALARIINMPKRAIGDKAVANMLAWAKLQGKSIGACIFGDFPAALKVSREVVEASLPSKLQAHHGLDYAGRGDDSARELARTELSALAAKHLPDLPSAKEMGIAPKAYKALQEFRVQIAVIALQVSISEPDEVISLVAAATELEDYIKSGEFSKQGDALERWSRVQQLQGLVKEVQGTDSQERIWLEEERSSQMAERLEGLESLQRFVNDAALFSPDDIAAKQEADAVRLCTIHASKGLEFPVVFVVGCEKGNLPLERDTMDTLQSEEETRCVYVALTRAEKLLYVTHAAERTVYGVRIGCDPSPVVGLIQESQESC